MGASCVIAHRDNLLLQLSLALAAAGIRHNIIASAVTRRQIIAAHMLKTGGSWFDPGSRCAVASVRTLNAVKNMDHWFAQVTLWVVDEGHHLVVDNEWHTAISKFKNPYCRGLLPTATPARADGQGLGRHADGVADVMVEGPPERWLIDEGYLTDYRIVMAESHLTHLLEAEKVGKSGDYSPATLKRTAMEAGDKFVGDVVETYLKWAPGKLWITFCPDVETAAVTAARYNAANVRAEVLTGDTDYGYRFNILQRFERREILQLVVVDIVSEGFDLPAIEGASSARKTESLPLFRQQFGRTLRPFWAEGAGCGPSHRFDLDTRRGRLDAIAASPKPRAWWIDHVNNVGNPAIGLPDRPIVWTLDRRGSRKGGGGDSIPTRPCLNVSGYTATDAQTVARVLPHLIQSRFSDGSARIGPCAQPYERFRVACPYCATPAPAPSARSSPEAVEGDLVELDADTLARLRGAIDARDMSVDDYRIQQMQRGSPMVMANVKTHAAHQDAQATLRAAMTAWCGARLREGLRDREVHRLFWLTWGVDILSARALDRREAEALTARITGTV